MRLLPKQALRWVITWSWPVAVGLVVASLLAVLRSRTELPHILSESKKAGDSSGSLEIIHKSTGGNEYWRSQEERSAAVAPVWLNLVLVPLVLGKPDDALDGVSNADDNHKVDALRAFLAWQVADVRKHAMPQIGPGYQGRPAAIQTPTVAIPNAELSRQNTGLATANIAPLSPDKDRIAADMKRSEDERLIALDKAKADAAKGLENALDIARSFDAVEDRVAAMMQLSLAERQIGIETKDSTFIGLAENTFNEARSVDKEARRRNRTAFSRFAAWLGRCDWLAVFAFFISAIGVACKPTMDGYATVLGYRIARKRKDKDLALALGVPEIFDHADARAPESSPASNGGERNPVDLGAPATGQTELLVGSKQI